MFDLPTKSELLALPTLYTINNITPIIYNFLGEYLNHLKLKDSSLIIPSITLDIVKSSKTLNVSLPYSNSYPLLVLMLMLVGIPFGYKSS